ncbi:phenylalanine--tRNA ligase subunit beta [Paraneptunicella aestuarii]|uniref:phenylalanine--tRNA ligase subunit beta n=1 Tax=Paraneptunicella aestuarii TaxID=2831148 RepID=UPI001E2A6AE9|nr:phenylalanine--tRNA ligase subunit beta [Paraneptunicella aestuarii]UAA37249.1 phenylalanine--tRNA ligase subunit beta [Paraneptunicella aestuarii]
MKFSEKWLREWVSPALTSEALAEQITMAGLEVDAVDPVAGEFSGVVVGEVVECGQHPDADKLRVTKVNVGQDELLDIVCGAPNCRLGLKVAVAVVGAVLPGDFKIKKAKLRGQPSHGMLCSYSELGISEDHSGIIELPEDAPIGTDIRDYLVLDDVTIEVDLTANRADCLSIKGLAREVGVLNNLDVTVPVIEPVAPMIDDEFAIELEANEACPRYLGRVIRNINLAATSPVWMQEKLRRCGVRSIDPVVDVTNYVLLELGHPMHAFDLEKLQGGIKVRFPKEGEKLTLLDGNEVELKSDTLIIADHKAPVAMAGIFGGLDSGVTESSRHIFLESAFFAPLAIAGKARQYGLHTDASHRYERGVDPQLQRTAMERATKLLLDIVGGEAGPITEAVLEQHIPKMNEITLRAEKLERLIGIEIPKEKVTEILTRLGLSVTELDGKWDVVAPSFRFDIAIEEDLVEEVARVYGYNNIPNEAPKADLRMRNTKEANITLTELKNVLIARDYQEAITYSFVDPKMQAALFPEQEGFHLPNPISADMSVMRLSLLPGLLQALSYNLNRQQNRVRLFETGLRFVPDEQADLGLKQEEMIAGVISGLVLPESWNSDNRKCDFFDLKGDVEAMLNKCVQPGKFRFERANLEQASYLHPGQAAAIFNGEQLVGYIGALHPKYENSLDLKGKTFVFELAVAALGEKVIPASKELSKYPANRRDLAIIVKDEVAAADILSAVEKCSVNQLVGLNLFDVYKGEGIPEGHKSLAISLTLQDDNRTLEEAEIQSIVNVVVEKLCTDFGASLRD